MRTSIKIGEIFGIPIRLHITLLIIIGFIAWSIGRNVFTLAKLLGIDPINLSGFQSYLIGGIMAVGLFTSVLIHELAHSLVARGMGVKIKEISLWIFGGMANMEEIPHDPDSEIRISIVGPLTSLGIGSVCFLLGTITPPVLSFILKYLGIINIILAAFNSLPAFPMDGGRILRAIFAKSESYATATDKAASVGKMIAIVIGIFGLFYNFFLILIAIFIYMGASQEAQTTIVKEVLQNVKAKDIMSKEVKTVPPDMPIREFIDNTLDFQHTGFPVVKDDEIVGIITLRDTKKIDKSQLEETTVDDLMARNVIRFSPEDNASDLWQKMVESDIGRFPIVSEGNLVGIVTRSDIMRSFKRLREIEEYQSGEI